MKQVKTLNPSFLGSIILNSSKIKDLLQTSHNMQDFIIKDQKEKIYITIFQYIW